MARLIVCTYCGRTDAPGGDVKEATVTGGLVLPARCLDRGACVARRLSPSAAYTGAFAFVREARS